MAGQPEIAVVDDDEAVRDSLTALLKSHDLAPVAYASARQLLAAIAGGTSPACIVSDVMMPEMTGLELQRELKSRGARVPVILVTGHGQIRMAVGAIQEGAADFIEKPFDDTALVSSIRRAIETFSRAHEADQQRSRIAARIGELSQRQREVMHLVVQGLSSKEVAAELGISPRTVETYRLWIMEKMEAKNLADLVRMVMLVDQPSHA